MRYFTHRNKVGRLLISAQYDVLLPRDTRIVVRRGVGLDIEALNCGVVVVVWDKDSAPFALNLVPDKRSGLHFEQGSGTPGRWWQEITEERAKELLGGGAR